MPAHPTPDVRAALLAALEKHGAPPGMTADQALPAVQQHNAALQQALNGEQGGAPPAPPPPAPPQVPDDSAEILELARHAQELRAQQGLPPDNAPPPAPPPTPPMSERIMNEIKARLAALRGH